MSGDAKIGDFIRSAYTKGAGVTNQPDEAGGERISLGDAIAHTEELL